MSSVESDRVVTFHQGEDKSTYSLPDEKTVDLPKRDPELKLDDDVHVAWQNLAVTDSDGNVILRDLNGYLPKGSMCVLIGASGAGKSVFLRTMGGREHVLHQNGKIMMSNRTRDLSKPHKSSSFNCAYVPPNDDLLIGDMSAREAFTFAAEVRLGLQGDELKNWVQELLTGLGIAHVADSAIGTALKRGLSGGEKRRVVVGQGLVLKPDVLLLDEPTSGLDASTAFSVIQTIRHLCAGKITVICALQQPNQRLLNLFDNLLLLASGSQVYFGPVAHSVQYFTKHGFPCPPRTTWTDHFLHCVDKRFKSDALLVQDAELALTQEMKGDDQDFEAERKRLKEDHDLIVRSAAFNFVNAYLTSPLAVRMCSRITRAFAEVESQPKAEKVAPQTTFWQQFVSLSKRNLDIGKRDITLYILQFVLVTFYGFMVGALFFQLPTEIGPRINDISNGLTWLVLIASFLQVFKLFYLNTMKKRVHQEVANQQYSVAAFALADFITNCFFTVIVFLPGLLISYFMMGQPNDSVGFAIWNLFWVIMSTLAMMDLVVQFVDDTTPAILIGQGILTVTCVFSIGAFIAEVPDQWAWLSELAVYKWATAGFYQSVFPNLEYTCGAVQDNGFCIHNTIRFPCDAFYSAADSVCIVKGQTVLDLFRNPKTHDIDWTEWQNSSILILFTVVFRFCVFLMMMYPKEYLYTKIKETFFPQQRLSPSPLSPCNMNKQEKQQQEQEIEMNALSEAHNHAVASSSSKATNSSGTVKVQIKSNLPKSSAESKPSLMWKDVKLLLKTNGNVLVQNCSGEAKAGRVLAIMGGSGAGKTTFLNALSGRAPYAKIEGSVTLGSEPLSSKHLDYVPQFDSLNPILTVTETLCFAARLKIHPSMLKAADSCAAPNQEGKQSQSNASVASMCSDKAAFLMDMLGLTTKAFAPVSSLTTGERKRLSIGLALVSDPSVLFLDEPSTGLDSEAALVVLSYVVKISKETGICCCLTLHQPSSQLFECVDDLLLLTKGQPAYFGPAKNALPYFDSIGLPCPLSTAPPDHFLDCVTSTPKLAKEELVRKFTEEAEMHKKEREICTSDETKQEQNADPASLMKPIEEKGWFEFFSSSPYYSAVTSIDAAKNAALSPHHSATPTETERFITLFKFFLVYFAKEINWYFFRLLELIVVAIFIGTLFLRLDHDLLSLSDFVGAMFFSVWCVLFTSISATPILVRNRLTFETEHLNNFYAIGTYQLAQFCASLPYHFVVALVYTLIQWFLVGFFDDGDRFGFSLLSSFLMMIVMEGVSAMIVEVIKNAMLSTTLSMVCLGCFFLFPGFFIAVDSMPRSVFWISYIMPTRYSLNSQIDNIFNGPSFKMGAMERPGKLISQDYFNLESDYDKWDDIGIIVGFIVGLRLIHFAITKYMYAGYGHKN